MKKPKLKKYLIRYGLIGLVLSVICCIAALLVMNYINSTDRESTHMRHNEGLVNNVRTGLMSSEPDIILSEGLTSEEYGTALAQIDFVSKANAYVGSYFAVLYDRTGNVISDPSEAVFIRVAERNASNRDEKTVRLESEYSDDWREIFEARDRAYEKDIQDDSGVKVIYEFVDNGAEAAAGEIIENVEIDMDEIYVKGGYFVPGKVHVRVKAAYSSQKDGIVKELLTKDMTPEHPEEYEKITKVQGRYQYDDTTEPHVWGVERDSWQWQDYEYYMAELSKQPHDGIDNGLDSGEAGSGFGLDKEFMHHLDGIIKGINVNNELKGSEYVLVTLADYSILGMWDEQLINHLGEEQYANIFMRVWFPAGFLVMAAFIGVFLAIGGFRYMKAKSVYDIKCYRIETTNAMAHDLKTPLTAISGYAENLLEQVQVDKREYYAKAIISNIEYMDQMIHDILELSKSEDERQTVSMENMELSEFVNEELGSFIHLIEDRGLSVSISGECSVKTDKRMMKSLIDNLLSNAVKYAAPESEIQIRMGEAAGTARFIRARNTGILTITNKLEEPLNKTADELVKLYVKGDNSRGDRSGSGVGLTIVENVAGKLKYKVSYEISSEEFTVGVYLS